MMSRDVSVAENQKPLTGDEFRNVLKRIDALGLAWTEDIPPSMRPKEPQYEKALDSEELEEIQERYPRFPYELGTIMLHLLIGTELPAQSLGTEDDLAIKTEITSELVLSPELKHDFFFANSLRIPCLDQVDWEVSMKLLENEIDAFPIIPYAAISIDLKNPYNTEIVPDRVTFAVDEKRIQTLIAALKDVQISLEKTRGMKDALEAYRLKLGAEEKCVE